MEIWYTGMDFYLEEEVKHAIGLKGPRSPMARQLATIRTSQNVSICERNRNPGFVPFITDQTFASATQKKDGLIRNFSDGETTSPSAAFLISLSNSAGARIISSNLGSILFPLIYLRPQYPYHPF